MDRIIGDWRPGGFPPELTLIAKLVLFGAMATRGVDLVAGDSDASAWRLGPLDAAAPVWLWGSLLLVGAVAGIVSMVIRRSTGIMLAHLTGAVVYTAIATGVAVDVWQRTEAAWWLLFIALVAGLMVYAAVRLASRAWWWGQSSLLAIGAGVATLVAFTAVELDGVRNAGILLTVAVMHLIMALGTAAAMRQAEIRAHIIDSEEAVHD